MASVLGVGAKFNFNGRDYVVPPRDLEMEARFESWLEDQAVAYVQRHAPDYRNPANLKPGQFSPQEHQMQLTALQHDAATQIYAFDGPAAAMALLSVPGQKALAQIQLEGELENGPISQDFVNQLWADEGKRREFQAIQNKVGRDPNRKRAKPQPQA